MTDLTQTVETAVAFAATLETDLSNEQAVAAFAAAEDAFTEARPDAAKAVRDQALFTAAEALSQKRRAAVKTASELIDQAAPGLEAAIARVQELPTDAQRLAEAGALSPEAKLLGELLTETRERALREELRRIDTVKTEELYDQAVREGNVTALRFFEREILAGLPDVSARKGKADQNMIAFNRLRVKVLTARDARIPAELREAQQKLQQARGRVALWQSVIDKVTGAPPDLERLRLRARDYREREAAKQKAAAEAGR